MNIRSIILILLLACSCNAKILENPEKSNDIINSPIVILIKSENISEKINTGPSCTSDLKLKSFVTITGKCPEILSLRSQEYSSPTSSRSYIIFLSNRKGDIALANKAFSMIPFSVADPFQGYSGSKQDIVSMLCYAFSLEQDPDCALVQSYFLSNLSKKQLEGNKTLLTFTASANDLLNLAKANVAVRTEGVSVLIHLGNIQTDVHPLLQGKPGVLEVNGFAARVRTSLESWIRENATSDNLSVLISFTQNQLPPFEGNVLHELAKHAQVQNIPQLYKVFISSENSDVLYECIHCFYNIINHGHSFPLTELLPSIDEFEKNPQKYVSYWNQYLEKYGYIKRKEGGPSQ